MLYLGVDVGTTAVKAAVFDPDGTCLSKGSSPAKTLSPSTGWSEQDMEAVWLCAQDAMISAVKSVPASQIVSIGIAGQGDGVWALDQDFKPVRNAILWNDQRAKDIVQRWTENGVSDRLANSCRTAIWPGTSVAAYAWLKQHEPETAEKIAHLCNAKDWIGFRLTGELATDFSDATIPFLDMKSRSYSQETFDLCDVAELREKVLQPRLSEAPLGTLLPSAANELGLTADVTVATGVLDIAAMHVGAGLNLVGESLLILGTTAVVSTVVEPSSLYAEPMGATVLHPAGDRWLNVQAPQSGASALDWFAKCHLDRWPNGTEDLINSAMQSPAGANGIVFLPYLTGERAPFVAPEASGAFLGLRATTTTSDLARAVLEGVTFSLRHCIDTTGVGSKQGFVITGGGGRSAVWRQVIADILGAPVRAVADDIGLWGAALLGAGAARGINPYSVPQLESAQTTHESNKDNQTAYDEAYMKYRGSVDALWSTWNSA